MADLARRVQRLEQALASPAGPGQEGEGLREDVRALAEKVDAITKGLSGTVGYRIRDTFECKACGSKGHVAARVTCTNCQKEAPWGWWPKR